MIEYKAVNLRMNIQADLNVLAKDGWRVVTCTHVEGQGIVVIMSRERLEQPASEAVWGSLTGPAISP